MIEHRECERCAAKPGGEQPIDRDPVVQARRAERRCALRMALDGWEPTASFVDKRQIDVLRSEFHL